MQRLRGTWEFVRTEVTGCSHHRIRCPRQPEELGLPLGLRATRTPTGRHTHTHIYTYAYSLLVEVVRSQCTYVMVSLQ